MDVQGVSMVITGAGSGLGTACARWFMERGARVALWDSAGPGLQSVAQESGAHVFAVDWGDYATVQEAVRGTQLQQGTPRVLINAGSMPRRSGLLHKMDGNAHDFLRAFQEHALSGFYAMTALVPEMCALDPINRDGERGVIIQTGSVAAEEGQVGQAAYAAAKAAIHGVTLPAARELSRFGIRVNTIAPGILATASIQHLSEKTVQSLRVASVFPKRWGLPYEFAALAEHLIENSFVNGAIWRLDGGMRLPYQA